MATIYSSDDYNNWDSSGYCDNLYIILDRTGNAAWIAKSYVENSKNKKLKNYYQFFIYKNTVRKFLVFYIYIVARPRC